MNSIPSSHSDIAVQKSASAVIPASLPERIVLSLFAKFNQGGIALVYPNGRSLHFGQEGASITARIVLNDPTEFFKRCTFYGNIGMGEAYTDGLWDTPDIAAVISWFIYNVNALQGANNSSSDLAGVNLLKIVNWFRHLRRENSVETSRRNISEHYDLGNQFYGLWLDPSMTYSSARFESAGQSLDDAQRGGHVGAVADAFLAHRATLAGSRGTRGRVAALVHAVEQ